MFIKHYAPNICLALKYGGICSVVIPQKILNFAQTFHTQSTHHPLSADQISSPWLKYFLRNLADKFKMPKFSKGHNSGKIKKKI